ncbi:PDDEXK-like family protein [Aureispira anguillae]|uniref:PD-(D/E)XK nuclease family protein n=1 Tax=Aureispira anguillae TaxID=2864201 RepID=A0A915YB61_9BACT|nr:PD-(D/E)XK nuclease family protein [Aureispira anguillae]BDS09844.1 PD-(D/E)XK nuclease family protein [Aureispira anguillae]
MKDLNYLLQKLEIVQERYETKRAGEEQFNIFTALHKEHDERRLHSRFIAVLLNPFASHGLGDLFLNAFLKLVSLDPLNYQKAIVYPEEIAKQENNNIDILIIDRSSKHAIIIENKIYAGDQKDQLKRYFEHVRKNERIPESQIKTFYLSLDGHPPSQYSLGKNSLGKDNTLEDLNGECLSYQEHILDWLACILPVVVAQPFLRESIIQYQKLIQKMTNEETNIEERKELKDAIGTNAQTMKAAKYLVDNFKHVKWHAIDDFWKELEQHLTEKGFKNIDTAGITAHAIKNIAHDSSNKQGEDCSLSFDYQEGIKVHILHEKNVQLWWGVHMDEVSAEKKEKFEELRKSNEIKRHEDDDIYWWKYLTLENGEYLWLKDFKQEETFNLINPVLRKETIELIVKQIVEFFAKHF